ncbi:Aflatoxin biosynthesis regulatory protein [Madurella mycetomatis]|uniref:Aflatoxin biosynthesis regulatory protein n=1 Tax=Madurella mycetomatis TaxID=100816 RepID=A0A175WAB0_9PEZI|nr:Aflatoxin biosynthesis regulatory protein [Madurella mycetomatis]
MALFELQHVDRPVPGVRGEASRSGITADSPFGNIQWHYDTPGLSPSSVLPPESWPRFDTPNSWADPGPTTRAEAGADVAGDGPKSHSCARESYDIFKDLICPAPDLHAPDANSVTVTAPLDQVLQFNKKAIDRLSGLLRCPCSKPGHRVMVHAAIISRILIWYQQAAGWTSSTAPLAKSVAVGGLDAPADGASSHPSHSTPGSVANLPSLPQTTGFVVGDVPAALGRFSINDQKMQAAIRSHLVLSELSNVSNLIELFDSSGVAGLNTSLAAWLRNEYDRTVSALKTGLNEAVECT